MIRVLIPPTLGLDTRIDVTGRLGAVGGLDTVGTTAIVIDGTVVFID